MPPPLLKKSYLGDGVYAEFDGAQIRLTTSNGIHSTNEIFLDMEVCDSLTRFIAELDEDEDSSSKQSELPAQINLVAGIMKLFGNYPGKARHMNAIIDAANNILAEFKRPEVMARSGMGLNAWLASDDTGLSSIYMSQVLSGQSPARVEYPRDADDFGRCYRMLRAAPELRSNSARLRDCPQPWPTLHQHWLELEKIYEAALTGDHIARTAASNTFHATLRSYIS